MKSVNLDRKLSATAHTPRRSIVIESPAGRAAQVADEAPKSPISRIVSPTLPKANVSSSPPRDRLQRPRELVPPLAPSDSRPDLPRSLTAVRVVEEFPSGSPNNDGRDNDLSLSFQVDQPSSQEEGITLADLPGVIEAEQAREQHRPVLRQGQGALLSELSALQYIIVKHVAALTLGSDDSPFRDLAPTDDLLDLIDDRKGGKNDTFWGKIFKGGNDKKSGKKKGELVYIELTEWRN